MIIMIKIINNNNISITNDKDKCNREEKERET